MKLLKAAFVASLIGSVFCRPTSLANHGFPEYPTKTNSPQEFQPLQNQPETLNFKDQTDLYGPQFQHYDDPQYEDEEAIDMGVSYEDEEYDDNWNSGEEYDGGESDVDVLDSGFSDDEAEMDAEEGENDVEEGENDTDEKENEELSNTNSISIEDQNTLSTDSVDDEERNLESTTPSEITDGNVSSNTVNNVAMKSEENDVNEVKNVAIPLDATNDIYKNKHQSSSGDGVVKFEFITPPPHLLEKWQKLTEVPARPERFNNNNMYKEYDPQTLVNTSPLVPKSFYTPMKLDGGFEVRPVIVPGLVLSDERLEVLESMMMPKQHRRGLKATDRKARYLDSRDLKATDKLFLVQDYIYVDQEYYRPRPILHDPYYSSYIMPSTTMIDRATGPPVTVPPKIVPEANSFTTVAL